MIIVISLTKPISEFKGFFANAADVAVKVDLSNCTDFMAWGSNAEMLIYNDGQIIYSCCYTEAYGMNYLTHVYSQSCLKFEYKIDYDAIERSLPVISLENAKVDRFYKFADGWMRVERVYRVSEELQRENDLWYRDRITATAFTGETLDFALSPTNGRREELT